MEVSMKELSYKKQQEINGGFVLPFIITLAAVVAGLNTARVIKSYYSITRN